MYKLISMILNKQDIKGPSNIGIPADKLVAILERAGKRGNDRNSRGRSGNRRGGNRSSSSRPRSNDSSSRSHSSHSGSRSRSNNKHK